MATRSSVSLILAGAGQYFGPGGTAADPLFAVSAGNGLFLVAADNVGIATASGLAIQWNAAQQTLHDDGSGAAPGIAFIAEPGLGIRRIGASQGGLSSSGSTRFLWSNTALESLRAHKFLVGSASAPGIRGTSDANTGILWPAADTLGMTAGGSIALQIDLSVTADDIRVLVFDVTAAALVRVSRGASGSGGVGFRLLRIPN